MTTTQTTPALTPQGKPFQQLNVDGDGVYRFNFNKGDTITVRAEGFDGLLRMRVWVAPTDADPDSHIYARRTVKGVRYVFMAPMTDWTGHYVAVDGVWRVCCSEKTNRKPAKRMTQSQRDDIDNQVMDLMRGYFRNGALRWQRQSDSSYYSGEDVDAGLIVNDIVSNRGIVHASHFQNDYGRFETVKAQAAVRSSIRRLLKQDKLRQWTDEKVLYIPEVLEAWERDGTLPAGSDSFMDY